MSSFEASLKQLEEIVEKLEKGNLPLEDSIKLFEDGVALSKACKAQLDKAEARLQVLTRDRDGSMKLETLDDSADQ